jgi:hypothetical protein
VSRDQLKRLFDNLEPAFGLQVSLGQIQTTVLCPALTSHSELGDAALREAGISPSTIRISVGDEDPRFLLEHLRRAGELALGELAAGFAAGFPPASAVNALYEQVYIDVHSRWVRSRTHAGG